MASKLVRRAFVAVGTIGALIVVLLVVAHLPFVRARVFEWARATAARELGLAVEAGSVHYNLATRSIDLGRVTIAAARKEPALVQADAIRVMLGPRLFLGTVTIQRIEVLRPRLTLVRHRDGTTNLPESAGAPGSPASPLRIGVVDLSGLAVAIRDEATGRDATLGPLDLTLDTTREGAPPEAFGPVPFALRQTRDDGDTAVSGTLSGRIGFDGSRVAMQPLRADLPEGQLVLEGTADVMADQPRVDVRGQLTLDLARARRFAGAAADTLAGTLVVAAKAEGPLLDPRLAIDLEGREIVYGSIERVGLKGNATLAGGRLDVRSFNLSSPAGDVAMVGNVAVSGDATTPPVSSVTATWRALDVDRVLAAAGVQPPIPVGSRATGRITVRSSAPALAVAEPDALAAISAEGAVTLDAADASGDSGIGVGGRLAIELRNGAWSLPHDLATRDGNLVLAGRATGRLRSGAGPSTLSGRTQLRVADLGTLLPQVQAAGVEIPGPFATGVGGELAGDVTLGGTTSRPVVNATLSARGLRSANSPAADLDAAIVLDRHALRVTSLEGRVGPAPLHASGEYAWSGRIAARFSSEAGDLGALATAFDVATVPVSGSLRVEGTASGTVTSPEATADLQLRDVSIDRTTVGPVDVALALSGSRLTAEATAAALQVRAGIGLSIDEPFAYEADAVLERTRVLALVPVSARDRVPIDEGTVSATLRARGTLSQPLESAVDAEVRALDLTIAGTRAVLETPARISIAPDRIGAAGLTVRVGGASRVQVSGGLGRQPGAEGLDVQVAGALADLVAIARPFLPSTTVAADGTFDGHLRIAGTLGHPLPSGTLTLRAATIGYGEYPAASDVTLEARIEPARLVVQSLEAGWQGATLRGDGVLPLRLLAPAPAPERDGTLADLGQDWLASLARETRPAGLTAQVTGLTPAALSPWVAPARLREVSGAIDATIRAEAGALDLASVRGSLTLDRAALVLAGVPFSQATPSRLLLERGRLTIDEMRWTAEGNELRAFGGADLASPSPTLDIGLEGLLDLRVLGALAPDVVSGGLARTDLRVTGPLDAPAIAGLIAIEDGELRIASPAIVAYGVSGEVRISDPHTATVALAGLINGGTAKITGRLTLPSLTDPHGTLALEARNVALEYPDGFATESHADLRLTLGAARPVLSGRVTVLHGTYLEPIALTGGLLAFGQDDVGVPSPASPLLSSLTLDLTVETAESVRVDNNYGRLDFSASLQIGGTAAQPGVVGRIEAMPDGELYLAGNIYRIQRLIVDLTDPRQLTPSISFLAETRVGNTPIEIELDCESAGPCNPDVRSQVSGVTDEAAEAMLFGTATDPAAAGTQLARALSGEIFGLVGRSIGLDTLRLEQGATGLGDIFDDPTLVAGDVDPASRLTLGKRIGDHVELAFSQDLADSGFTWITRYEAPFGMSFRLLLLDDQSRSYEFRHEPDLGGRRRTTTTTRVRPRIAGVRLTGDLGFPEADLRRRLRLVEGDRFDFAAWQGDRERLGDFYHARGFLEARIRARRESSVADGSDAAPLVLEYAIERGPRTELIVRGAALPDEVVERIRARWISAVFDGFLERDARALVLEHLYQDGRLGARVDVRVVHDQANALETLQIDVTPGPVVPRRLEFTGNAVVPTTRLQAAVSAVGPLAAWLDPAALERVVEAVYQEEGLLAAEVEVGEPAIDAGTSVVRVTIREGDLFRIARVALEGTDALPPDARVVHSGLERGTIFRPQRVRETVQALEQQLRQRGFLDAQVSASTTVNREAGEVDVTITAQPGARSVLAAVVVDGNEAPPPRVARALALEPGEIVDAADVARTRRQLYDSGLYRSVRIALEPQGDAAPGEDQPVRARISLEGRPQYRFRYGLALNDEVVGPDERERRLGIAADVENRNLLGLGATAGVSARLRRDQQVGRLFVGANRFFGLPLRSNLFLERGRQEIGSEGFASTISDETGIRAEQSYRLFDALELRYGYGFGRNRTVIEGGDFDIRVNISRLTTAGVIDRRRNPFDPTGGWFGSASLELSRPGLGSDLSFLKTYFQALSFRTLREGLVLASGVRVGLARTYEDQELIPGERFFAGGATSVRGYREDDLGPRSILGDADGGRSMLVLNGELRFPLLGRVRGVGFVDAGTVYPSIGEIRLGELQVGVGAGVRVDTPIGLLRLDLGLPANRRSFDPKWRLHFGLGQAF